MSPQPKAFADALKRRRTAEARRLKRLLAIVGPEDRRKLTYINRELSDDSRDPLDHDALRKTREDILRRYEKRTMAVAS